MCLIVTNRNLAKQIQQAQIRKPHAGKMFGFNGSICLTKFPVYISMSMVPSTTQVQVTHAVGTLARPYHLRCCFFLSLLITYWFIGMKNQKQ